jgi:hypothetical protein
MLRRAAMYTAAGTLGALALYGLYRMHARARLAASRGGDPGGSGLRTGQAFRIARAS